MYIRILTFVSALLLAVPAFSQRVKIYGTVRDADGRGVEFASVRVQGTGARTSASLQGQYTLYAERRDSVLVVCSQIGYGTRRRLLLSPVDSVRLDFTLQTIDAQVGEAVVTGQAIQTTGTQRIQMADVQTMPSVTGNGVEEVIATQAGVSTHNELSSQYNVRGGSFDENVVYLDGLEVHRPMLVRSGQQEGLSIINPDM
ncbi:MAG: carboxypeptidase regulatory-like domain-containing protein, partial [Alloprevotella sp.]|nr:carboxypeptidase regulatory-like domain-containing protein [Alloprevotella sp.]